MNNRAILLASLLVGMTVSLCNESTTQAADGDQVLAVVTPETEAVTARGLAWLAKNQQADGSVGSDAQRGSVAVTALAGMAWTAGGGTPRRGPYGENIAKALAYLIGRVNSSGFIAADGEANRPMYGHGFATLFLAECLGESDRDDLRKKVEEAVQLIVATQNDEGGWRYQPRRDDADISVTVCQVMALRAARNAGVFVPSETIDRAIGYIRGCQNADGGYRYQLQPGKSAAPRSAAGLVELFSAGIYKGDDINATFDYLKPFAPGTEKADSQAYFYYGQYYQALAFWHRGDDSWKAWYAAASANLALRQEKDGRWPSKIGDEYATAMALIVLQLPNDYLPIFER